MLTHSYYEEDPRVRREAEALAAAGRPVDVFALRRPGIPSARPSTASTSTASTSSATRAHRLGRLPARVPGVLRPVGVALTRAARAAPVRPGPGPHAAGLPRVRGSAVAADRSPGHPRPARGDARVLPRAASGARPDGWCRLALRLQERPRSRSRRAVVDRQRRARRPAGPARASPPSKVTIVRNAPSLARFDPARTRSRRSWRDGTLRLVYAGALSPIYELDVVLDAIAPLVDGSARRSMSASTLYGRDFDEVPLRDQPIALGIADRVRSTAGSRSRPCPAAIARATSASRPPADTPSPTTPSRRRSSSMRRWVDRSSRRACRWSSARSTTTS